MRKTIFIDKDGTLIKDAVYTSRLYGRFNNDHSSTLIRKRLPGRREKV